MLKKISNFNKDECGAVTVDWVVLTAAVVGLSGAAYFVIEGGALGISGNVNSALSNSTVSTGTNDDPNAGITVAGTAGGS